MKSVPVHVSKRYSIQPISQKVRHKISKGGYVILRARAHRHFSSRCIRTWLSPLVIDTPPAKWAGDGVLEIPSISQSWFLGMAFQQNTFSAFGYLRLTWVNMFSVLSFSPPHYPAPPIKCRTKIIAVYKSQKKFEKKKEKKEKKGKRSCIFFIFLTQSAVQPDCMRVRAVYRLNCSWSA